MTSFLIKLLCHGSLLKSLLSVTGFMCNDNNKSPWNGTTC